MSSAAMPLPIVANLASTMYCCLAALQSKWAVSVPTQDSARSAGVGLAAVADLTVHVACIGDLNRQGAERHRGGGALCLEDTRIWLAFADLVKALEPCTAHMWTA